MSVVALSHDGFARETIYRERVPQRYNKCAECERPAKFRYTSHPDDDNGKPRFVGRYFCSIGCWRSSSYK